MSYDLYLLDPVTRDTIELEEPHQMRGGTYAVGGTTQLHLNITYNYGDIMARLWPNEGIRTLYGLTGAEVIPILEQVIGTLGDDVNPYYWKSTEGNVKAALCALLAMSRMRPDGVWSGD